MPLVESYMLDWNVFGDVQQQVRNVLPKLSVLPNKIQCFSLGGMATYIVTAEVPMLEGKLGDSGCGGSDGWEPVVSELKHETYVHQRRDWMTLLQS